MTRKSSGATEIDKLLEQAEQLDTEQDAAMGVRRGDELPEELTA